jgi:hypothetical protein
MAITVVLSTSAQGMKKVCGIFLSGVNGGEKP